MHESYLSGEDCETANIIIPHKRFTTLRHFDSASNLFLYSLFTNQVKTWPRSGSS